VLTRADIELCLERIDIRSSRTATGLAIRASSASRRKGAAPRLEPSDDSLAATRSLHHAPRKLAGSPCTSYEYVAYDVVGNQLA
jgi:hypothetical protein